MAEGRVGTNHDSDAILDVAQDAALEAGKLLMARFGSADIQEKATQNLVTQADLESERLLTSRILEAFPDHTIMGEETEFTGNLSAHDLWVLDPLDGTNNYAHRIPQFCVSVAYVSQGLTQVGVIYDPVRNELFTAMRGAGALLNGQPIHVSRPTGLDRSIIATGFYYDRGHVMETTLKSIERLFHHNIRGLRRMGAAALDLSWVACGRFQGFFEYQLSPWDYAAGALLVEEAGGQVWDRAGQPLQLNAGSIIAASDVIAEALVDLVKIT